MPSPLQKPMMIFVTGGPISGLGKGILVSTLGALLLARGFKVRLKKFDPYLNMDPGTMNPQEHGEVFVTEDGMESDLDLGSYERFTGVNATARDSMTTGRIYLNVIEAERKGVYLGKTIQVVPHITNEIKRAMTQDHTDAHFTICEIGGSVGDIEAAAYLEAIRQLRHEYGKERVLFIHLGWVPCYGADLKTKLVQASVKGVQTCGIQPDLLVCRCAKPLSQSIREKISLFCNVDINNVIQALDLENIYFSPIAYHEAGLDHQVISHFNLKDTTANLSAWETIKHNLTHPTQTLRIAVVGKYTDSSDTYCSLMEALCHGGIGVKTVVETEIISSESLEDASDLEVQQILSPFSGIIVPGGFGKRGTLGMIKAIQYAREKKVPFLGICYGMQLAIIEGVRQLTGYAHAGSSEWNEEESLPVIALLLEWMSDQERLTYREEMGATMRLGSYPCTLDPHSLIAKIYQTTLIHERHRHRYEVNNRYVHLLERAGLKIAGQNRGLVECIERSDHPWFIGTQFHPELKSRPFDPHPLFCDFVRAALVYKASQQEVMPASTLVHTATITASCP